MTPTRLSPAAARVADIKAGIIVLAELLLTEAMPTLLNSGRALTLLDVACAQQVGLNAADKRKYVTTRNMSDSL